ncbi:probable mannose-P-dolichol utilization defect 1 protein homolog [Coccomyxa sp. Obi]|nr:probable mannose-P-dolichol utilization defect 1 protein homolog [Coccomyxa sp. Obi]
MGMTCRGPDVGKSRTTDRHGICGLPVKCSAISKFTRGEPWCTSGTSGRRCRGAMQVRASAAASQPTVTQLIARILGYCVVAGSFARSVPQIVRILKNKSAEGISLAAQYAELVAYSITVAYNLDHGYAFSTYGDTAACWVQDIILIVLIAKFRRGLWKQTLFSSVLIAAGCWALLSGAVSRPCLAVLQASTILIISLGGRIPQILLNIRRGNTGELSPLTSGLNLAGNVARIFTTLVLTQDMINLAGALVQALLNGILVWQSICSGRNNHHINNPSPDSSTLSAKAS